MRFNLKVILLGGIAFYVTQFIVSMLTGSVIHEGVLAETYKAHAAFWRPELNREPPDLAALMPRWIAVGLIAAFIMTAIYDNIRAALSGPPLVRGGQFGLFAFLFHLCFSAGWSGVFAMPDTIWIWWNVEMLFVLVVGGAALGYAVSRLATD